MLQSLMFSLIAFNAVWCINYEDVSDTTIEITKSDLPSFGSHQSEYLVTVERDEDLIDFESGQYLASRVSSVSLSFLVTDGKLLCNGIVIPIGVSEVKIEANVITGVAPTDKKYSEDEMEELNSHFTKGLVNVKFDVEAEESGDGLLKVQRLTIKEHISELDGCMVKQTDFSQQIVEIYPDGSFFMIPELALPPALNIENPSDADVPYFENKDLLNSLNEDQFFEGPLPTVYDDLKENATSSNTIEEQGGNTDDVYMTLLQVIFVVYQWFWSLPAIVQGFLAALVTTSILMIIFGLIESFFKLVMKKKGYETVTLEHEFKV